ncbi:lactococcin 972 family bacteriocin [Leuconostoc lactis]|uniref:lactococcin 972 family bacteriocin n=1 Tax=Leuconostoc lactis TaxID=1246 RepID=UPI00020D9DA5|nr:lactococcin 972 family bacteriocin [Leuconostoc lactis]KQB82773.1 hypothetical protein AN225_01670 [Leuconostoc lactis]ORI85718.1 hypothetical protein BMS94_00770 [Leuconostoc lactis]ORI87982.1 hypothetical protein BMS96_00775 [Leuconostoc lactis]GHC26372.1 hypothetical protein GCM10008913_12860 [Leuconostoc lactis KCTC 3528 = DSM 20202]
MNKFKKVVLTGVIASGIFSGISFAHADQVGGGDWRHGVGSYYVWSYYFHNYRNHSSSVSGQYFASSGRTSPGYDAQASAPKSLFGNKAYYDFW